jgi:hypothetical protein
MDGPSGWPLVGMILAVVAAGLLPGVLLLWLPEWWLTRRAQRDWDRGEPERRRRWAEEDRRQALQHQLQKLEEAIREERLSDDAREWRRQYRAREAGIRREARRRLGLPEETVREDRHLRDEPGWPC